MREVVSHRLVKLLNYKIEKVLYAVKLRQTTQLTARDKNQTASDISLILNTRRQNSFRVLRIK